MADANGTIPNAKGGKGILLRDLNNGAPYTIPANVDTNGNPAPVLGTGNMVGTGDKQFVSAAQSAALAAVTGGVLLSTTDLVNLNQDPETPLYTVPAGKTAVITMVVIRKASTSLTTASISFGFNAGTDNDVIANATHTVLTGNTLFVQLLPKVASVIGAALAVFSVICNTKQGGAATCSIDVFGYLF